MRYALMVYSDQSAWLDMSEEEAAKARSLAHATLPATTGAVKLKFKLPSVSKGFLSKRPDIRVQVAVTAIGLVVLTGALNFALGFLMAEAAGRRHDARRSGRGNPSRFQHQGRDEVARGGRAWARCHGNIAAAPASEALCGCGAPALQVWTFGPGAERGTRSRTDRGRAHGGGGHAA